MKRVIVLLFMVLVMLPVTLFAGWEEGVAAFRKKDYKTAATEFQEVVKQRPEWYAGHYMLGLSLEQLENREKEALTHMRKAYDLNPNELSIKVALGRILLLNDQSENSILILESIDRARLPKQQQEEVEQLLSEAQSRLSPIEPVTPSERIADDAERFVRIQNNWYKDNYIHNQNGKIEQGPIAADSLSAQWKIIPVHSGWVRIQNRRNPDQYLHNQNGQLEVGVIQNNWASAMWKLVPAHSDYVRIQNSWNREHYIHNQKGTIELGPIQPNWASALWKVE